MTDTSRIGDHHSASGGEFAQGSWNVDGDGQSHLLVVRCGFCRLDDFDGEAFEADERGRDSLETPTGMTEPSLMTALRTHAIEGRLS